MTKPQLRTGSGPATLRVHGDLRVVPQEIRDRRLGAQAKGEIQVAVRDGTFLRDSTVAKHTLRSDQRYRLSLRRSAPYPLAIIPHYTQITTCRLTRVYVQTTFS